MLRDEIPEMILKIDNVIYHVWWSGEEWQGVSQNVHERASSAAIL